MLLPPAKCLTVSEQSCSLLFVVVSLESPSLIVIQVNPVAPR